MIIWTNISESWHSTAADFDDTPYEGMLIVKRQPPKGLEAPGDWPFLRYDAVIIRAENESKIEGSEMIWNEDLWTAMAVEYGFGGNWYTPRTLPQHYKIPDDALVRLYIERPKA